MCRYTQLKKKNIYVFVFIWREVNLQTWTYAWIRAKKRRPVYAKEYAQTGSCVSPHTHTHTHTHTSTVHTLSICDGLFAIAGSRSETNNVHTFRSFPFACLTCTNTYSEKFLDMALFKNSHGGSRYLISRGCQSHTRQGSPVKPVYWCFSVSYRK